MKVHDWFLLSLSIAVVAGGLVGCIYSYRMLVEARIDVAVALRLAPDREELKLIGEGHVRLERNRFLTQTCFLVVGLISIPANFTDVGDPARAISRIGVFAGIVLVYANSVLSSRTRRAALEAIRDDARTGHPATPPDPDA